MSLAGLIRIIYSGIRNEAFSLIKLAKLNIISF